MRFRNETEPWKRPNWWQSATVEHSAIAQHYDIPQVNMRAALWADDAAVTPMLRWEDFGSDWTHPNDLGHAYISEALMLVFATALTLTARIHQPSSKNSLAHALSTGAMPAGFHPLHVGNYVERLHARCVFGKDVTPFVVSHHGWEFDDSDPIKAAWSYINNTSNALVIRMPAHHNAVFAYTEGWSTGDAEVSCSGGCNCHTLTIHSHKPRLRVMNMARLEFFENMDGRLCDMTFKGLPDAEGNKGFFLLSIIHDGPVADHLDTNTENLNGIDFGRDKVPWGQIEA